MKQNDLAIGNVYVVGGDYVIVRLADVTGCNRCALEPICARFAVRSNLEDYHRLCGGCFRADNKSVVFIECKQGK